MAPDSASSRRHFSSLLVLALLGAACSTGPRGTTGSLQLLVSFAGPSANVTRVVVEILTPKLKPLEPPVTTDLPHVDGRWTGLLPNLPAQALVISAVAIGASGEQLFHEQTLVSVAANATTLVAMTLRPAEPLEAGPIILAATASASQVAFDHTVSLAASVTDFDPAEVPRLQLSWTASAGSFQGPTDQSTATWKAPPGPASLVATLRFTVKDSKGLEDSKTIDIVVVPSTSAAVVFVELNSWPRIDAITADAVVVPTGGLAHLHGAAHDPDGDPLSYSWSLDACRGTFPGGSTGVDADLRFVVEAAQQTCKVSLTVSDGRGGTVKGSLTLTVVPARG